MFTSRLCIPWSISFFLEAVRSLDRLLCKLLLVGVRVPLRFLGRPATCCCCCAIVFTVTSPQALKLSSEYKFVLESSEAASSTTALVNILGWYAIKKLAWQTTNARTRMLWHESSMLYSQRPRLRI